MVTTINECGIKVAERADDDDEDHDQYLAPQLVPFLYNIDKLASGGFHNLCVDKNGAVWCFGSNSSGQLGLGIEFVDTYIVDTATSNPYFKGDTDANAIVFIDCGDDFSLCINKIGKAFMFGANYSGECGKGRRDGYSVHVPFCIQTLSGYEDVIFESGSCGCDHTVLISSYPFNALYGFGSNTCHQTGNIDHEDHQHQPYLTTKQDLGIEDPENANIVRVLCDINTTIVICEC